MGSWMVYNTFYSYLLAKKEKNKCAIENLPI